MRKHKVLVHMVRSFCKGKNDKWSLTSDAIVREVVLKPDIIEKAKDFLKEEEC